MAFYRKLGAHIADDQDNAPHVDGKLDDGTDLAWGTVETIRGFDADYISSIGGHHIALAFDKGSPAAVDTAFAELIEAGYTSHVDPWDAHWGQNYATLLDPDGNSVDLYAELYKN
nr:VOC family protein [Arthrobacter alpinus]